LGHWEITGVYSSSRLAVLCAQQRRFRGVGRAAANQFWKCDRRSDAGSNAVTTNAAWFIPAAFARPTAGAFGVQPRNSLRNPRTWNLDMGLADRVHPRHNRVELQSRLSTSEPSELGGANSNRRADHSICDGKDRRARHPAATKYMF